MFLSVSVSSADVACGRGRVWGRDAGSAGSCWGGGCCRAGQGWAGGHCRYLIQQDDVGTLQDGASNGDTLLLPPTQLQPPFPHLGVVSCGHKGRNVLCWCPPRQGWGPGVCCMEGSCQDLSPSLPRG